MARRITPLTDVLRATAPSEPDVAAFLAQMERGRREGPRELLGPLARDPLSADDVADIVFALASPDTIRALTVACRWDRERVAAWLTAALVHELLR